MALGNDRLREEPPKSKTRSLTALGQSLRRGLTTRRTQKTVVNGSGNTSSNTESEGSVANNGYSSSSSNDINSNSNGSNTGSFGKRLLRNRPSQQHLQQQQQEQNQHITGTKPLGYTPSPLSRGALPASGMLTGSTTSLGLGTTDAGGKHGSSIYGTARTQRIGSASSSHKSASTAAAAAAMSGTGITSRKTIYGSAGLSGISKSGFNNSTPSLGSSATGYSTGPSEHHTVGRKGPPPPENHSANSSNQNRDYSFAIAGNVNKSTSNGSSNSASAHGIGVSNSANSSSSSAVAPSSVVYNAKSARSSAGAAVPIAKEGYLSKKTDINPSTSLASALSRGWKVYRVVLKGAKLFFYKPPSESELRAMFPEEIAAATNETAGGYVRASFSAAAAYEDGGYTNSSGFPMSPGEVDSGSRAILFEPGVQDGEITAPLCERYVFGECFTEVDLRSLKFKRYVSVLIFDDTIVVLKRRWVRQGIASSFFGAVSNKMRFGKGSRSKVHQPTDNSSLVSAELGIKGKGYFTKWKYHSQYPLTNIEAIEAASSRFSVAHAPGMLGHIGRESQAGSSRASLYSIGNSSVSSIMTRTSTVSKDYSGALSSGLVPGFQIFVGGKERVARMFVATTSDAKNNWLSRFTAAKASYARKLRQRPRENSTGARRYNGAAETACRPTTSSAAKDAGAEAAANDEKPKTAKDMRARLYWGTQRHPELVVATETDPTNEDDSGKDHSTVAVVVGGSKSALVHEMVFCTTLGFGSEKEKNSKPSSPAASSAYGRQFVAIYRLFMDDSEFIREFQRYSELVTPELENYNALVVNLCEIVTALAAHYEKTYIDDHIETLRSIVEKSISSNSSNIDRAALALVQAAIDRMVPVVVEEKHAEYPDDPAGKRIQTIETGNDTVLIKSPASSKMFSYEIVSPPVMPSTSDSTSIVSKPAGDEPLRARSRTHHGEPDPTVPQIPSVPELVRVEITGLSPSLLLRIPPTEFAHQLYLFHKSKLAGFDPKAVNFYVSLPGASTPQSVGVDIRQAPPSLLTVGAAASAEGPHAVSTNQGSTNAPSIGAAAGGTISATSGAFTADSSTGDNHSAEKLFDMQRQLMVFTQSEPHFLTRLVHHQLLIDLPLNRPARRSALLQHWVRIGEECRAIGDAVSWTAIAMAVTMAPIARLRETWHGVSLMWKDIIVTQWVPLLVKHGVYDIGTVLSKEAKRSRPLIIKPQTSQKGSKSGFFVSAESSGYSYAPIPYYGSVRLSIERQGLMRKRIYEPILSASGASDSGDKLLFAHHGYMYTAAEEVIKGISDTMVERARTSGIRSRASSVSLATKFQRVSGTCSSRASTENLRKDSLQSAIDSSLLEHPHLQSYLSTLAANPLKIGDELVESDVTEYDLRYLLSISLQCEPSVSDQYRQHIQDGDDNKEETGGMSHSSLRQAPGSILPLVCPETVPSTNILQWITPAPRTPVAQAPSSLPPNRASNVSGRAGTFSHSSPSPAPGHYQPDGASARPSTSSRMTMQARGGVDQQPAMGLGNSDASLARTSGEKQSSESNGAAAATDNADSQPLRHKRSRSFPANVVNGIHGDEAISGVGKNTQANGSANASSTAVGRVEQQMNDAAHSNAYFAGSTIYASNGDLSLRVLRVQYVHGRESSSSSDTPQPLRFVVEVQGGTLATLFDLLINGIEHLSAGITTDKGVRIQLPNGAMPLLLFNRDVFQRIFMASFRHFCIGLDAIDTMRRTLATIESDSWDHSTQSMFGTLLDLCENWLGNHFSDFLDSTSLRDAMAGFLLTLRASVRKAGSADTDTNHQDTLSWKEQCERADMLCSDLVTQLLEPAGYTPLDMILEKRAKYARNRERRISSACSQLDMEGKSPVSLLSVSTPDAILVSLNRLAQTHFARCSFNDWLVTFCLLEVQTHVPLPWYPKRRVGHVPSEDDLVVSDIYQILQQTHRAFGGEQSRDIPGAGSGAGVSAGISFSASSVETSLVRTLPQSIQSMLELHRTIRGWVVRQIADPAFSLSQRVAQIQKFLTIVKLCRKDSHLSSSRVFGSLLNSYMREAGMIPDRQPSYRTNSVKRYGVPGSNSRIAGEPGKRGKRRGGSQAQVKYVPSFVERAIASALVSPESRQFVRAWNEVATENHTKLDTLEAVLRGARDWEAFAPSPTTPTTPAAKSSSETPEGPADSIISKTVEATETSSKGKAGNVEKPNPVSLQRSHSNPVAEDIDISEDSMTRADCFVPCLGWLLENMVSLCYDTPDTLVDDSRLINLAKRHRVFIMLCICEQLGTRCQEAFALHTDIRIDMDQLSKWVSQTPLQADELKTASQREAASVADDISVAAPSGAEQMMPSSPTGIRPSGGSSLYAGSSPATGSGGGGSSGSSSSSSSGAIAGDRAFSFSLPSSHTPGFVRAGDTLPSMRNLPGNGGGGFAKRSIANLRSSSNSGAVAIPGSSFIATGGYGTVSGASGPGSSNSGTGGMPVFGSPPAPIPRSLTLADGPNNSLSSSGGPPGVGIATHGGIITYFRPFGRLVTDEIEKVRQEIRERDRLERELRDREQAIERQRNERTKILKRQLKEQQQRRAKNEPLLKMANLMNKVNSSTRDSSTMDIGSQSAKASASTYGGVSGLQTQDQDTNRMSSSSGTMRPRGPALPNAKPANVINLINSTIAVEHGYTKRDFVFRIVTEEGGQYLLQAPDVEQMEDWLGAMRDAATEAAARRLTLFVEEAKRRNNADGANSGGSSAYPGGSDMDSSSMQQQQQQQQQQQHIHGRLPGSDTTRSRFTAFLGGSASAFGGFSLSSSQTPPVPSRGAIPAIGQQAQSKNPVAQGEPKSFGVDLAKLMPDPKVLPPIVEKCLTEIELRGLEEVGIYRVSGAAADVSRLRLLFNTDPDSIDLSHGDFQDINVVSGVMKQFLRELPEPLMTYNLYDGFINAASIDDYDERLWAIKDLVHALPAANYTVLKRLGEHLERVTDYEEVNHMYGTNLALVFGPSLLRPPPGSSSFALAMSNLGHAQSVIKNLILQYHWIFNVEEEAEPIDDGELDSSAAAPDGGSTETPKPEELQQTHATESLPDSSNSVTTSKGAAGDSSTNKANPKSKKRESVAVSPLSPAAQADMDQLTVAVNKLSV